MKEWKQHIRLNGFYSNQKYKSKRTPRNTPYPHRDRAHHGAALIAQYSSALTSYEAAIKRTTNPIFDELGIYLRLTGYEKLPLPFEKIDNRDFRLHNLITEDGVEKAVVFVPEDRRHSFYKKVDLYLDSSKDNEKGIPKNHTLIDGIQSIQLADIRSFWTDDPNLFPKDASEKIWIELWLHKVGFDTDWIVDQLSERLEIEVDHTSQRFFDSTVNLIKASVAQLEHAIFLIPNLKELRKAKDVPIAIVESSFIEQAEWAANILARISRSDDINTSIVILDSGVNYDNPLLRPFCSHEYSTSWHPDWPHYDVYSPIEPFQPHGSLQAGIAGYGNLLEEALSSDSVEINFVLESGRILPPRGANERKLYGDITLGTLSNLEAQNPHLRRVYSLAVTAQTEYLGGQPSSWSAQIDDSAFNFGEELSRLFVISTGNNLNLSPAVDHWVQAELAQIEDPAQAWNALTVGAYTELTTVDEDGFAGWSPLAEGGDLSPAAMSSRNWGWIRHAPYKPEIVAESGNRLLSPDKNEITEADCVSLLTTSGRSQNQIFDTTRDSSAATAAVSNYAAQLMAQYSHFWPETIRGLLVHSAQWTEKMNRRFQTLRKDHTPTVAKETMLRTVGYGVPNVLRAQFSLANQLTIVSENNISPCSPPSEASSEPKLGEMQLYELPWPSEELKKLPDNENVKLKVTLSYFIEPNPSRRGFKQRYSYQSHGLRFEVIRPGQSLKNFMAQVNKLKEYDDYDRPEGDSRGWLLGSNLRARGSIHSDTWIGSAQDLASMNFIAIRPVGGWWKSKISDERWKNEVRYSLLISVEAPESEVDLYSEVENIIENQVMIET